jgi:hypothetical protein
MGSIRECGNCVHYKELAPAQVIGKKNDGTKELGEGMEAREEAWCDHLEKFVSKTYKCPSWSST